MEKNLKKNIHLKLTQYCILTISEFFNGFKKKTNRKNWDKKTKRESLKVK